MKNRTIPIFVLAYVLLASTYSVAPAFADTHFTIQSILDESKLGLEEKLTAFETNGLEIPPDANTLYNDGLVKYQESLDFLENGDFENARDPGLDALSLFEDAYEELLKAEEELVEEQEKHLKGLFEIAESIVDLQNEADELRTLILNNELDISLDDLDAAILLAEEKLSEENTAEAEELVKFAEEILDEILNRIEYKAEEEQDERVSNFVEDLVSDLEDVIDTANVLGIDDPVIEQLQALIDELTDYDDINEIYEITGESSDNEEVLSTSSDLLPDKVELEAELVNDEEEDIGEAEFEQRNDRKKLSVEIEDQTPDETFDVLVGGESVGEITTDEDGEGELDLDSRDGNDVPLVADSDIIEISGGNGVILSGIFSLDDDDERDEDDEARDDDDDERDEDDEARDDDDD
ncbi:hypothetical protein, partial [Nitrosopumilus sp.]|uniref:hypothetical protein n=1 Tax=Nitrosopumilus sp. TaxID=2024843 RepID=UPI0026388F0B